MYYPFTTDNPNEIQKGISRQKTMLRTLFSRRLFSTTQLLRNTSDNAAKPITSSCVAGTKLNLKIYAKGEEPVALKDEEYPPWLWNLLDQDAQNASKTSMQLQKREMRRNNVKKIKYNNFLSKMK